MSSTAVHVRRLKFDLAPMRPRQGGTTSTFTLRVTKPSIISDGHTRFVTPGTRRARFSFLGLSIRPPGNPSYLHWFPMYCPSLVRYFPPQLELQSSKDSGGTDETLDVHTLPVPGDTARRSD